jgi:hypothetical protein
MAIVASAVNPTSDIFQGPPAALAEGGLPECMVAEYAAAGQAAWFFVGDEGNRRQGQPGAAQRASESEAGGLIVRLKRASGNQARVW